MSAPVSPPKMTIVNLETQARLQCQFNPSEVNLSLQSIWNKQVSPGQSHTHRQFSHTDDLQCSFSLFYRVINPVRPGASLPDPVTGGGARSGADGAISSNGPVFSHADREFVEGFILALQTPRNSASITQNSPPPCLMVWPNFLSFEAIVKSSNFTYTMFNRYGRPIEMTIELTLEEFRNVRRTSLDMQLGGFQITQRS